MSDGAVASLLSDAHLVVLAGQVVGVRHPGLGPVHAPGVGEPGQPHGAAVGGRVASVALQLPSQDVPLGGGGARSNTHLIIRVFEK